MKRTWIVLTLLVLSLQAFASTDMKLDGFEKRFKLKRNDTGELTSVKMNFLTKRFSIKPYLVQIKNDIKEEIERMRAQNKSVTQAELDSFYDELIAGSEKTAENEENARVLRDSLSNLPNIDVDKSFAAVLKKDVLKKFEIDFKKILKMFDLAIIADPTDARFFYRKNVTYEVVRRALDFAKKRFDNIPLLNLASFIIVKVHDLVLEQRMFHQNMLLHYLENFDEKALGMTKTEADRVFSSLYEARIAVTGYGESNNAAANWDRYGTDKFFAIVRNGNTRIRRSGNSTMTMANKVNWGFVKAKNDKGEKVILNLVNNQHMFSGKMATAYNFDKPNKVKRFRSLLNLGQVGLGFLPIPGWIKGFATQFAESFYVEQKLTEGALVGYFESTGNTQMYDAIMKQNINPYLVR